MVYLPDILKLGANRVWRSYPGGMMLDKMLGKPHAKDAHFPEDWIASTTNAVNPGEHADPDEGISKLTVNGSAFLLTELLKKYPDEMTGAVHYRKYGAKTRFLLKYLDSAIRLHLQVHPTRSFSLKHLNCPHGKTEAYIILAIRDEIKDPHIYFGFQRPLPEKELKKVVERQDIDTLLGCFDRIPIAPGDVFIVPGGLPHAIGPGVLMIEIMEPTDFVARLEFERGGYVLPESARFMGKGIDFALDMISFENIPAEQIKRDYFCKPRLLQLQEGGQEYILIDDLQTDCFRVHQLHVSNKFIKKSDSFYVALITKGNGSIRAANLQMQVQKGDRFFIPYKTDSVEYVADTPMDVVLAFPPP